MNAANEQLTIAVPRGALLAGALDLLAMVGVDVEEVRANDRKLFFAPQGIITMRPSDVPTYVEHGVADVGIVGKDVLMEQFDRELYELLDLEFGACRMIVAKPEGAVTDRAHALPERVATKYTKTAERYFASTGRQAEVIEVKGSVELAAIAGLAEAIVDLTATGTTLRENGLVETEQIAICTARLVANPAAYRLKAEAIDALAGRLRTALATRKGV